MNWRKSSYFSALDKTLPWLFLAILLFYTFANFLGRSSGLRWDSSGVILYVFDHQPEPSFHVGDRIIQIGDMRWEEFEEDLRHTFFRGAKPGDVIPATVERNGQIFEVQWVYPEGPNQSAFLDQLVSEWVFAYFFWLAGILTMFLVRPKDVSWLLMALFNFLTATWLIAGSGVSSYHTWSSAVVFRMAFWLCAPVYLHLHWVFPRPLGKLPSWLVGLVYGLAIFFTVAQAFQLLPNGLYVWAFSFGVGGSLILLLVHIWRQPSIRRDFRLPLIVLMLAVVPALIWAVVYSLIGLPSSYGGVGILSLSLLPLAYLYTAFRRRLGNLELRVNRFFTMYLFLILLGIVALPLMAVAEYTVEVPNKGMMLGSGAAIATAVVCLFGYPAFENFMDRRVFGILLTSKRLLEEFSTQITTSVSVTDLIRVLQEKVFPSLLIRQFAFLQYDEGSLQVLSTLGLAAELLPKEQDVPDLIARSGSHRFPDSQEADPFYTWIRLSLPLKLGDRLTGFWLLGRRDPDDLYAQQEIAVLSSLANLTAIALSNILQTERLKSMFESNISRYEQERLNLAHDLHDSILNEMAALLIGGEAPQLSPKFQQAYDALTQRLRDIVNGLRPPMLVFGLKLALEDFAEKLRERNQADLEILTDIETDREWRYPEMVENNVYRIVQEACENSLRYARARKLLIFGRLHEDEMEIRVEDDGLGLDPEIHLKLNDLVAGRHFGLVGMLERANFIGAELSLLSKPGEGTQIQMIWKSEGR